MCESLQVPVWGVGVGAAGIVGQGEAPAPRIGNLERAPRFDVGNGADPSGTYCNVHLEGDEVGEGHFVIKIDLGNGRGETGHDQRTVGDGFPAIPRVASPLAAMKNL